MNNCQNKIFCIMGPTASGKSDLALMLAKKYPFEIISVDSAMVYRGMDIGTAKPISEELQQISHHLIDICDPSESYSVGQFYKDALSKIEDIFSRDRIPLLVGGTMMYFRALQHGISSLPEADSEIRNKLQNERDELGLAKLYERLKKIDPESVEHIKSGDSQRIQRALEVYELTGTTLSEFQRLNPPVALPYKVVNLILSPADISLIRNKIKVRFENMLGQGFIDEVKKLYERENLHVDLPSIRSVGYRQVWQHLEGVISYEKMLELVPIVTGQLAKRQLTWLKSWKNVMWFDSDDQNLLFKIEQLISS